MPTGGVLGTGASALLAFQRAMSTVGHNVANATTPGYSRQRVEFEARAGQPGRIGQGASDRALPAAQLKARSVTAWLHAPSGAAEITGSDPPESSVSTVRW